MRFEEVFLKIYLSIFVIAPDKGLLYIGVFDVDSVSCYSILGSFDYAVVCSEGNVFLPRECCSLSSDDGVVITFCGIFIPSYYC